MTTFTIATSDYSNVSVAIHAAELLYVKQFPYDEITPHSLLTHTHTHTHSQRAPSASFDASLFTHIKGRRPYHPYIRTKQAPPQSVSTVNALPG